MIFEFGIAAPEKHRLRYQEFIPCNCSTCKGSQKPFSYSLDRLHERLRNKRHQIECDISYEMIEVRSLIDDFYGIYSEPSRIIVNKFSPEEDEAEEDIPIISQDILSEYFQRKRNKYDSIKKGSPKINDSAEEESD